MMTQRLFLMALALGLFSFSTGCNLIVGDNNNGNTNTNDNTGNDNDDNDNGNENDNLADFTDPDDTAFRTSDVFDVDGDIVRFNTETDAIVWAEDGTEYQPGSWTVNGNFLAGGGFQVRFGTEGGVKKAYFTETGPATICQIQILGASIIISPTNVTVPQN
jgi:hypothetical protein